MDKRWTFRIAVALLLAVVGWWVLDEDAPEPVTTELDEEREERPDYFMETFTVDATGEDGTITYRLEAPHMEYFLEADEWFFEAPLITFFPEQGEPWRLRSERGRAWEGVSRAHLMGEVHVRREGGPDNRPANVDTSEVFLRPEQQYAETDEYALYWREDLRIEGVGAEGYFGEDRLRLLSDVRGRYEESQ